MNGWIKHFSDGSSVIGPDSDPKTSWKNTRLSDISSVSLSVDGFSIIICGNGKYWQSDDMMVPMVLDRTVEAIRIKRRVLFHIDNDRYMKIQDLGDKIIFSISSDSVDAIELDPQKWLVAEIDLISGCPCWYLSEHRI